MTKPLKISDLKMLWCINCEKYSNFFQRSEQANSSSNVSLKYKPEKIPRLLGVCRDCGMGYHYSNEGRSKRDIQDNFFTSENGFQALQKFSTGGLDLFMFQWEMKNLWIPSKLTNVRTEQEWSP